MKMNENSSPIGINQPPNPKRDEGGNEALASLTKIRINQRLMKFILGTKVKMSQIFDEEGNIVPMTLIQAGPCKVLQVKTAEKDKYDALELGFVKKTKKAKKTEKGKEYKYKKEFKSRVPQQRGEGKEEGKALFALQDLKVGDEIDVSLFQEGDKVKISGFSKGKGFQGGVKRWGFSGRGSSHGVKHEHQTLGSTGTSFPERVIKGRKMPGRTGNQRISVKNLKIVRVDKENNILAVRGAVPGRRGTLLEITG